MVYNGSMKNKHLEHPEDSILTLGKEGAVDVIKFLKSKRNQISVKYDGAPAVVYGVNTENGRFFVGTKSVFNKKKIKINYTHDDIETNHGHIPNVASILHTCLETLPTDHGVYQCDFIGYGGNDTYKPNTITYKFDKVIKQSVVVATHTQYVGATIQELDAVFHGGRWTFVTAGFSFFLFEMRISRGGSLVRSFVSSNEQMCTGRRVGLLLQFVLPQSASLYGRRSGPKNEATLTA